jgi:DNA topoisomerase-1
MRTDSVRVADDALADVRRLIGDRYGASYVPEQPVSYKTKKGAQDAHEAIRPTSLERPPDTLAAFLSKEELALYTLIWNRFVASQMMPAVFDQTTVDISAADTTFRASGQIMKFDGFIRVYTEGRDEEPAEGDDDDEHALPMLREGESLTLRDLLPEQHFTQPPPRFSQATLIKELEEKGIGRPSTYATILSTIQDRGYVDKGEGRFTPTELGTLVNDLLVGSFPDILNVDFTARMEDRLDKVEEGDVNWVSLLQEFYTPFKADLATASATMRDVKREEIPTEHTCEKCGSPMVIKWGKNGSFLACSGYPACKNTKEFLRRPDGTIEIAAETTTTEVCDLCGSPMVVKRGRFGEFLACSRYPECKSTKAISLGVACPREGCGGFIAEKRSRRGKSFYGCSNYAKTKCDFVLWDRPLPRPCPSCGAKFLVKKISRRGTQIRCVT